MNKYDLLKKKLDRGVRISDYISTYSDRPNDAKTAAKCTCLLSPYLEL